MLAALLLAAAVVADGPAVRVSPDQTVVTAAATKTALDDDPEAFYSVAIAPSTSDGAKATMSFALRCGELSWTWETRRGFELRHPGGACTLAIRAADYKPVQIPLPPTGKLLMTLQRMPVVSGVITDAQTSTPIAGADVLLPDGSAFAVSDADGRFRVAVDDKWPAALRVVAPGRATKLVPLPKIVADSELAIVLSRGGAIALTLAPPLGEEPVTWEVRRADASGGAERTGTLDAGQNAASIESLEPGAYRVIVKGEGPLQRAAVPVTVRDGDVAAAEIRIDPAVLELDVRFGGAVLGNAELQLWLDDHLWESAVTVDADGRAREEIWQRGRYTALVKKLPQVAISRAAREITGDGLTTWRIDVPDRTIRGRVTDDAGEPVARAHVELRSTAPDRVGLLTQAVTAADGTFEFKAVAEGAYVLKASRDGYQPRETPPLPLLAETSIETRDLVLQRTAGREVRVVNAHGHPVRDAMIYLNTQNGTRRVAVTDDHGRAPLPLAAHEAGLLFAVPRSGSIGIARFRSLNEAERGHIDVRVPDGTASLEIRAESTDGEPLARLVFDMAIDGTILPTVVMEGLVNHQGMPMSTGSDGRIVLARLPPGRYQLWPLASRADYLAVRSASPPPPAVNVMLTPGHHTASFKFER